MSNGLLREKNARDKVKKEKERKQKEEDEIIKNLIQSQEQKFSKEETKEEEIDVDYTFDDIPDLE